MAQDLGRWDPLDLAEAIELFEEANFRWWVTGGHALELHLGRSWRSHSDVDISFCRQSAGAVRDLLADWDIHVAAAGRLSPWSGEPLRTEANQNNLWCRRSRSEPWSLDLTVSSGDENSWIFRRDPSHRVPWERAVLRSPSGVPYLAPDLQLLFKSKDPRPKDELDLVEVVSVLDASRCAALAEWLADDHPWQARLDGFGD